MATRLVFAAALHLVATPTVQAQVEVPVDVRHEAFAGSEIERYLRVMQLAGAGRGQPWSLRALSASEVEVSFAEFREHPWASRYTFRGDSSSWGWVHPRMDAYFNSAFPFGVNDGAVWAGRGLTTAVHGGAWFQLGAVSGVLAPVAFFAQNAGFALAPAGATDQPFADPRYPNAIDLPQRFGDHAYWRVDPGQSELRLELSPVALGLSTANQIWGPGDDFPILLGNNAPGFPHVYVGSSEPLSVGIGDVHGRIIWGRLDQSPYSPVRSGQPRRFAAGLIGTFLPKWMPGLEIGGTRFFHMQWPAQGITVDHLLKPFEGLLKSGLVGDGLEGGSDQANQLASIFMRWAVPRTGFEVYGEFAREDHNADLRDLLLEPDHNSGYLLGFMHAWTGTPRRWVVVRGEVVNTEQSHLNRVRYQSPFYVHTWTAQGHTVRGQILGSPAAYGGSGVTVAAEVYQPQGRLELSWKRALRDRRGSYWETGTVETEAADVIHMLGVEARLFRGPVEVRGGVLGAWEFNRYFEDDAFNLNLQFGATWRP